MDLLRWQEGIFWLIARTHFLHFPLQVHLGSTKRDVQVARLTKPWIGLLYALLDALQVCRECGNLGICLFSGDTRSLYTLLHMRLHLCEVLARFLLPGGNLVGDCLLRSMIGFHQFIPASGFGHAAFVGEGTPIRDKAP